MSVTNSFGKPWIVLIAWLLCIPLAAQDNNAPIPQGSSIPGLSAVPLNLNGPGYVEMGGGYSGLTNGLNPWRDGYLRGALSHGNDVFDLEVTRQSRYGDSGWYGVGAWTHSWNPDWFTSADLGSSVGGFFIPRMRVDGFVNRKVLPHKQLVLQGGAGYDKSKTVNSAARALAGASYYFAFPVILEGHVTWTWAAPGNILARSESFSVIQGREKEHYVSLNAEFGREGYELVSPNTTLFDFGFHKYSANWRQWIGVNWGFNAAYDYESNFAYHRNGGTLGIFMDF